MRSQMFCKINAPKNAAKFKGKHLHQILLTPAQIITKEILKIVTKTFFNRTSLNNCFFHQFNLLTVLRRFCFGTYIIYLNFRAILGYIKIHRSRPLGLYIFFTYKYYRGKNYTRIKRVHDYFIWYGNYFHKTPQGSEYTRVLNMPLVLKMPAFRICQGSKYTKALNMPLILNLSRFWTNQGAEYVTVNRVLNMLEYASLCLAEYACICLNMLIYAWIWPNLPEWLLLYISLF